MPRTRAFRRLSNRLTAEVIIVFVTQARFSSFSHVNMRRRDFLKHTAVAAATLSASTLRTFARGQGKLGDRRDHVRAHADVGHRASRSPPSHCHRGRGRGYLPADPGGRRPDYHGVPQRRPPVARCPADHRSPEAREFMIGRDEVCCGVHPNRLGFRRFEMTT
jgi:hypothetical protein